MSVVMCPRLATAMWPLVGATIPVVFREAFAATLLA